MSSWKAVRVFISSTFRDMHAERDHLVRVVFPELKKRCRQRHVHLIDVDLRWGVTEDDAESGRALDVCLDEIDACRPYFLGILGHRYGFIPEGHRLSITAQEIHHGVLHGGMPRQIVNLDRILNEKLERQTLSARQKDCLARCYAWDAEKRKYLLREAVSPEDLKIILSVFRRYSTYKQDQSFFFFRSEALSRRLAGARIADYFEQNEENRDKLVGLKKDIIDAKLPAYEYGDIEAFGHLILDRVWRAIEAETEPSTVEELDWLGQEAEYHEFFMADRTRRFVGRRELLDTMHAFCEREEGPSLLVMTGEPGSGKSALMARFTQEASLKTPARQVLSHFVGASPASASLNQMIRRFCTHLNRSLGHGGDAPEDTKELLKVFSELLTAATKPSPLLLVIDAVNQLETSDHAHSMNWLPQNLPSNLRVVISTVSGDTRDALLRRSIRPQEETVAGLTAPEIGEMVGAYLAEIRHEFPNPGLERDFYQKVQKGSPLYILVALEELRVFGRFEQLGSRINSLPEGVPALFDQVLERIESDFNPSLVADCMSYLACGQHGLSAEELQVLLRNHAPRLVPGAEAPRLPDMIWERLYRSLSAYLFERSEVIDFFHGQLKEAVSRRYLGDEASRVKSHSAIADYFETRWREPYPRALSELPYHRTNANDLHGVERVLCDLDFVQAKVSAGMILDLAADYRAALATSSARPTVHWPVTKRQAPGSSVHQCVASVLVGMKDPFPDIGAGPVLRALKEAGKIERSPNEILPRFRSGEAIPEEILPHLPTHAVEEADKTPGSASTEKPDDKRWDRIREFANFVSAQGPQLKRASRLTHQIAHNHSASGATVEQAASQLEAAGSAWLKRDPRPSPLPARPLRAMTMEVVGAMLTGAAFAPNTGTLVTGGYDGTVRIWDIKKGECVAGLAGHTRGVEGVAVTPDGRIAISASNDGTLRVWDVGSCQCLRTLWGHETWVTGVDITADGAMAISSSLDYTLRVWNVLSGECVRVLKGHDVGPTDVALSADGKLAVSAAPAINALLVWDVATGDRLATIPAHRPQTKEGKACVVLSADGRIAATAGDDGFLRLWDVSAGLCLRAIELRSAELVPKGTERSVALTSDGRFVAATFDDGLRILNVASGECVKAVDGVAGSLALAPDASLAVSVSGESILLLDIAGGEPERGLEGHAQSVVGIELFGNHQAISASSKEICLWEDSSGICSDRIQSHDADRIVDGVALSSDGRSVATSARDNTIGIWDVESGRCRQRLRGHTSNVSNIILSRDSRTAVSSSWDNTLRVWDVAGGRCLRVLSGHTGYVLGLAMTRAGDLAASASMDKTVRVWDIASGEPRRTFRTDARAVAISADGRTLLAPDSDNLIRAWDVASGRCLVELRGHTDKITCVDVTGDGRTGVAGSRDGSVKIWNVSEGRSINAMNGMSRAVTAVALTPDGRRVVAAYDFDSVLRVNEVSSGRCINELTGHMGSITGLRLSEDGRTVVSASSDYSVRLWDLETGKCLRTIGTHLGEIDQMRYSEETGRLAWSTNTPGQNSLGVFDSDRGTLDFLFGHTSRVLDVAVSPDGRLAIAAGLDGHLLAWDLTSRALLRTIRASDLPLSAVALSEDGRIAAAGGNDKIVTVWDLASGDKLKEFSGHTGPIRAIALTPDGSVAISGEEDGTTRVWDLMTGQCRHAVQRHSGRIEYIGLTPDARLAVTSEAFTRLATDVVINVWDTGTGAQVSQLKGHRGPVPALSLSPDGQLLISGGEDHTVRVWDMNSGECIATYLCSAGIKALSRMKPDGRFACGSEDGQLHFLTLQNYRLGSPVAKVSRLFRMPSNQTSFEGAFCQELTASCPWCHVRFAVPRSVLERMRIASSEKGPKSSSAPISFACGACQKRFVVGPDVCDNRERFSPVDVLHRQEEGEGSGRAPGVAIPADLAVKTMPSAGSPILVSLLSVTAVLGLAVLAYFWSASLPLAVFSLFQMASLASLIGSVRAQPRKVQMIMCLLLFPGLSATVLYSVYRLTHRMWLAAILGLVGGLILYGFLAPLLFRQSYAAIVDYTRRRQMKAAK